MPRRFTEDEMKQAVLRVTEEGVSVNRVARENGLCKKTLKSYVDKYLSSFSDSSGTEIRFRPNYEINQVFTNDHEKVFEEHLVAMDRAQRKITRDIVRQEAYNFATECNVHVPKTWNVRKQAGLDWMYGYLNRHPNVKAIIVRNKGKDKSTCHQIVTSDHFTVAEENGIVSIEDIRMDRPINDDYLSDDDDFDEAVGMVENVAHSSDNRDDDYYTGSLNVENGCAAMDDNYLSKISVKTPLEEFIENITTTYGLIAKDGFVDAEQVYNLGEIALVVDDQPNYRSHKDLLVTACCFMNAAGDSLPPFFVFPTRKFRQSALEGFPIGANGTARPNGQLDSESFLLVLKHFQQFVNATPANKVALIMDADEHHVTVNSIDFCEQHGIDIVTLPPQYNSNLQPAGNYVFPVIKFLFNQCVTQLRANSAPCFSARLISLLFCRIHPFAFSSDNVCKGFSENGIFPLNEEIFQRKHLLSMANAVEQYELPVVNLPDEIFLEDVALIREDDDDEGESSLADCSETEDFAIVKLEDSTSPCPAAQTDSPLFARTLMEEFYDNLVEAYNELEVYGGVKAETIYNVDKIEIRISALESNSSKPCISIFCFANALGHTLPPFLVYPEDDYSPAMLAGGIPGMRGISSPDGRVHNAVFLQMLQHFQRCVGASPTNRVVLIMDCKEYHVSLQTIDFCESNGVILVTVPPTVSELFRPLETTAFKTLPSEFQRECADHARVKHVAGISMFDIASLLSRTFERCFVPECIVLGFSMTGLWPLNQDLWVRTTPSLTHAEKLPRLDFSSKMLDEDARSEDDDFGTDLDSDITSSLSDCDDIVLFYSKIENFLRTSNHESDEENSADDRIFVLGELRLKTCRVMANVMFFVNAVGMLLPPYLIYATEADDFLVESSLGITGYRCAKNVFDTQNTLLLSIDYFREHSHATKERKAMLLLEDVPLDGSSRLTKPVRAFGENNGVVFVTFPSSDMDVPESPSLHPLENSFVKSLKIRLEEAPQSQLNSINKVVEFLELALLELFVVEDVVSKFKDSGICSSKLLAEDEESDDERPVVGHRVKVDLGVFSATKCRSSGKNFEDFIIEEEIEEFAPEIEHNDGSRITFLCANCETEFGTQSDLEAHERVSACRYCDLVCCSRVSRDEHELKHVRGTLHCCAYCEKECTSRTALIQHRRKHQK